MKKLFAFLIVIFIGNELFSQIINEKPQITLDRPADYEYLSAPDSSGNRTPREIAVVLSAAKTKSTDIKLPYPIIFIHGLNSDATTWLPTTNFLTSQYGLTNGGVFDYCLGYDGNSATANTIYAPTAGADMAIFSGTWIAGDYYYVNFDVGSDGSFSPSSVSASQVWSNQSAIVKQGKALHDAILRVLQLTGRDKVILMGHSMGGLASREYLQNPSNWIGGQSHVAKLVTTGTPHGGSNSTSFGILSSNTNGQSEAIRDLRRTYYYSNNAGVYLSGGIESLPYMDDQVCCYFYNSDVNCNGTGGTSENIIGLNQKSIYNNLDYACIIGECSGCVGTTNPGDGIVWDICANLNNYYTNITTNLFYYYASAVVQIHTDLPQQYDLNMQGLDEPEYSSLAYHVGLDTTYTGFLTVPAATDPNSPYDTDVYKFSIANGGNVNVSVNNLIIALGYTVNILNSSNQIVGTGVHNSGSTLGINFTTNLTAGNYYLQLYGIPTSTSYTVPYNFIIHKTSTTGIDTYSKLDDVLIYPNPASDLITIKTSNIGILGSSYSINDQLGRQVSNGKLIDNTTTLDISNLPKGFYLIQIGKNNKQTFKFIKE